MQIEICTFSERSFVFSLETNKGIEALMFMFKNQQFLFYLHIMTMTMQ